MSYISMVSKPKASFVKLVACLDIIQMVKKFMFQLPAKRQEWGRLARILRGLHFTLSNQGDKEFVVPCCL